MKILDFGIAKLINAEDESAQLTQAGDIFGTPAYMSPEQCNGAVTHQSDIYSLGIILFEMITGRTPFFVPGERAAQVLIKQVSEPAPPPSAMVSGRRVPREVDELVLRVLSKEPAGRPADCERLAQEVRAVVGPLAEVSEPTLQIARPVYTGHTGRKVSKPEVVLPLSARGGRRVRRCVVPEPARRARGAGPRGGASRRCRALLGACRPGLARCPRDGLVRGDHHPEEC